MAFTLNQFDFPSKILECFFLEYFGKSGDCF
jgi:hypothetical protein